MTSTRSARPASPVRLLVLGATGAVGHEVLHLALHHPQVAHVVAPTRRSLPPNQKLTNPVSAELADSATEWGKQPVDAVVCALGTTLRQAGSKAAFAAVDRDLTVALAHVARRAGAQSLALNSSLGARAQGPFYLRTKFETEEALAQLSFESYTVVRPSLIDTPRTAPRPAEQAALWVAHRLGSWVPRRYRPVPARAIAYTLLEAALAARPGRHVVESDAIAAAG